MRRVGIVTSEQSTLSPGDPEVTAPELVFDVTRRAVESSGLDREAIDVTMSGSSDVLDGRAFGFVFGLEAVGAWPPVHESHVEQDGAWAAWYAWLKLLAGEADSALVFSWGKASEGSPEHVTNTQLDPFTLAPLGLGAHTSAALQADAWMARVGASTTDLDRAVDAAHAAAADNPRLGAMPRPDGDDPVADPLLARHCAPQGDGACAMVLAVDGLARELTDTPAWIAGADQRIEPGALGHRDLARSPATTLAGRTARARAGWSDDVVVDVAELCAPYAHQVPLLTEALELDDNTVIDPSGGALAGHAPMVAGLSALAEAAAQIRNRSPGRRVEGARRALAHATGGHANQHEMVWLLEVDR